MVMVRVAAVALTAVFLAASMPVQAQQPFEQCGEIQLVFRNPDLQRKTDGNVHAAGSLFAQFQAIGQDADEIVFFGFSFGPVPSPIEDDSGVCDLPPEAWFTGAYILNYRADTNPDDGFFINLQTDLVPDGQYTAAVHAYNDADQELARAWTNAIVNNCDGDPPARCEGDAAQIARNDKTAPWPIVLPGDGDLDAAPDRPDGATLTIEFAEELSDFTFYINGREETQNLTEWPGRLWDDDLRPGYGPYGLAAVLVPECEGPEAPQLNECNHLGIAYYYNARPITDDDIVRVEATDMAGNVARKEIHIGSGAGGAITDDLPNLQITVDSLSKTINAGESAIFRYELTNTGGTTAHPFARIEQETKDRLPGWEFTWTPAHQPTDPGASNIQELAVRPPADVTLGTYRVNATIEYEKGNQPQTQTWNLRINVGNAPPGQDPDGEGPNGEPVGEDSPGLGMLVALALVGTAFAMRRRA